MVCTPIIFAQKKGALASTLEKFFWKKKTGIARVKGVFFHVRTKVDWALTRNVLFPRVYLHRVDAKRLTDLIDLPDPAQGLQSHLRLERWRVNFALSLFFGLC